MYIILGVLIGIVASWLLGFLLVDKETMRDIEAQYENTNTAKEGRRAP